LLTSFINLVATLEPQLYSNHFNPSSALSKAIDLEVVAVVVINLQLPSKNILTTVFTSEAEQMSKHLSLNTRVTPIDKVLATSIACSTALFITSPLYYEQQLYPEQQYLQDRHTYRGDHKTLVKCNKTCRS
jgi:hypothetical protein